MLLECIPAVTSWRQDDTLDRSQICNRTHRSHSGPVKSHTHCNEKGWNQTQILLMRLLETAPPLVTLLGVQYILLSQQSAGINNKLRRKFNSWVFISANGLILKFKILRLKPLYTSKSSFPNAIPLISSHNNNQLILRK